MRHQQFRQILILVVVVLSLFLIQELILTTHSTAKSSDTTISSNTIPDTTTPQTSTPPDSQQIIHHPPSSLPVINDAQELVMVEFEKLAEDHYLEKVFKNFTSPKPAAFGDCKFTKLYDAPTISPTPINNPTDTDFTNTPTSKLRPTFTYEFSQFPESCTGDVPPTLITIVLLYHNQSEYQKMLELIYAQSFQLWQLQIVVPADEEHNHQLENEVGDQRVFITHLPSKLWSTPPSLKNKILENITTSYLLYWNGQDLLEPTFLEKCIWYLETHQNVPICGSHFISFNGIEEYWDHGYENSTWTLNSSIIHLSPVLRTSEMRKIGGYNSDSIRGLEDWELLLKFGELGYQGFTIQEPLWWYNTPKSRDSLSLLTDKQIEHFSKKFPRIFMEKMLPFNKTNSDVPSWIRAMWKVQYRPKITKKMNFTLPFIQYVPSTYRPRALFILPFLEMGGSDHYNLEIIRSLAQRGWEISIVTTHLSSNPFLSDALKYSPDIFLLPNFLEWIDFQRFLCYFLRSRAPDLLLLTNSFVGYQFLPYMDSFCPCHKKPVIVDIVHSFTETWWMNGGYPYMSVHQQQYIDRTISTSQDLSNWMYQRGKDKKNVAVLYLGTNVTMFSLEGMNTTAMKKERDVPLDTKIFLWVGRFHHEKRPQVFVDAARILLEKGINNFYALVIGSGKQYSLVKSVLESNPNVANNVRLLGELEPEEIKLWMAISDVLVVTSITEGTPLVIFEALSMQNFVLSTNVGAISEQVDPSTGILVDISPLNKTRWELESHLFAHEMDHILNIPTSDLRNGGEIARKKSVELFNSDYYIDMFINELCAAERESTTRVRPAPVQYDDKKLKELLYNSMRFIML